MPAMPDPSNRPPNLIVIMTDQWRADHVGWAGHGYALTPNLDSLAARGATFSQAITVNPICMPARGAFLTGRYCRQIGALAMSGDLDPQHPTFPRALQGAGYLTAAIGKLHLLQGWPWNTPPSHGHDLIALEPQMRRYGFDHVWEVSGKQLARNNRCRYTEHLRARGHLDAYRAYVAQCGPNATRFNDERFNGAPFPFPAEDYIDHVIAAEVLRWIDEDAPTDRPFCLYLSFCGPHPPFDPPAGYLDAESSRPDAPSAFDGSPTQAAVARAYRAMIRLLDDQIGAVLGRLQARGLSDRTVVAFTSDHGEMLGERGLTQKQQPFDASVRIPLLIADPRSPSPQRCEAPVELTDLAATLLDYAGLDPQAALSRSWPAFNDHIPARSLRPFVAGDAGDPRAFAFAECNNRWQLLRSAEWAYLRWLDSSTPEQPYRESLYHLPSDPGQHTDLAGDPAHLATLALCRRHLDHRLIAQPPAQTSWAPLSAV
jgi:arylsulfatase A-like enzyme